MTPREKCPSLNCYFSPTAPLLFYFQEAFPIGNSKASTIFTRLQVDPQDPSYNITQDLAEGMVASDTTELTAGAQSSRKERQDSGVYSLPLNSTLTFTAFSSIYSLSTKQLAYLLFYINRCFKVELCSCLATAA